MPTLTPDNIFAIVLTIFALGFFAIRKFLNVWLECQIERLKASIDNAGDVHKLARYASAHVTLRFLSSLVIAASTIALALGVTKALANAVVLFLPDRAVALMLLIGYCGLPTIIGVVKDDMHAAMSKFIHS